MGKRNWNDRETILEVRKLHSTGGGFFIRLYDDATLLGEISANSATKGKAIYCYTLASSTSALKVGLLCSGGNGSAAYFKGAAVQTDYPKGY